MTYMLMLVGCGLFAEDAPPAAVVADESPTAAAHAPLPQGPVVPVVPERPAGCHHFFSEADANHAFAVAAEAEADCAFEGIRGAGNQLVVRYKPTPETEVGITLMNASCEGEGEVSGSLRIAPTDDATRSCPAAVAQLRALADSGSLPVGTLGTYGEP